MWRGSRLVVAGPLIRPFWPDYVPEYGKCPESCACAVVFQFAAASHCACTRGRQPVRGGCWDLVLVMMSPGLKDTNQARVNVKGPPT